MSKLNRLRSSEGGGGMNIKSALSGGGGGQMFRLNTQPRQLSDGGIAGGNAVQNVYSSGNWAKMQQSPIQQVTRPQSEEIDKLYIDAMAQLKFIDFEIAHLTSIRNKVVNNINALQNSQPIEYFEHNGMEYYDY